MLHQLGCGLLGVGFGPPRCSRANQAYIAFQIGEAAVRHQAEALSQFNDAALRAYRSGKFSAAPLMIEDKSDG